MAPLVPVPVAVASVTFTPAGGDAPFTATFHADVLGSLKPFVYAWDFGDGSLSDGSLVPMHTFTGPGNYTIKVTVRDTSGTIDSGTVSVLWDSQQESAHTFPTFLSWLLDWELSGLSTFTGGGSGKLVRVGYRLLVVVSLPRRGRRGSPVFARILP